MDRDDVGELHYITHTDNLASIERYGLLSHVRTAQLPHRSVAMQDIQDRRARKRVPGGRPLHEYVNLFLHCRNSMMYKVINGETDLAVIRVDEAVLDLPGAIVADGNAACDATRFMPSPAGLSALRKDRVFARSWLASDRFVMAELKRQRSAEVLIPDRVEPSYIKGYYIYSESQREQCERQVPNWPVEVSRDEFFK